MWSPFESNPNSFSFAIRIHLKSEFKSFANQEIKIMNGLQIFQKQLQNYKNIFAKCFGTLTTIMTEAKPINWMPFNLCKSQTNSNAHQTFCDSAINSKLNNGPSSTFLQKSVGAIY